jgi:hypothetical protein
MAAKRAVPPGLPLISLTFMALTGIEFCHCRRSGGVLISGGAPQEFWGAGFGDDHAGNAAATMIPCPPATQRHGRRIAP